jgi:hypothetical protein
MTMPDPNAITADLDPNDPNKPARDALAQDEAKANLQSIVNDLLEQLAVLEAAVQAHERDVERLFEAIEYLPCPVGLSGNEGILTIEACTDSGRCNCHVGYVLYADTWEPEAAPD